MDDNATQTFRKKCTVSMAKEIKILDDAHSCHWNINQKILQKWDYELLRNMFLKP